MTLLLIVVFVVTYISMKSDVGFIPIDDINSCQLSNEIDKIIYNCP